MRPMVIDTPFVTFEEYARRSGQTLGAVTRQADRGQLPVSSPSPNLKRRYVNMVALFDVAEKEAG